MSVTTTTPALQAVEDALASGHGNARTLAAADRFRVDLWDDRDESMSALLADWKKLADVHIAALDPLSQGEHINYASYQATFVIDMAYYLGHEAVRDELRATYAQASIDYHKIRSVLCWPGNLTEDAAGNDTGLASGCLSPDLGSGRSTWRAMSRTTEDARLLLAQAVFPAVIHLTFPT